MPPISFKDCNFSLTMPDGTTQVFKGHDAFLDHLLNDKSAKELGLELKALPEKEGNQPKKLPENEPKLTPEPLKNIASTAKALEANPEAVKKIVGSEKVYRGQQKGQTPGKWFSASKEFAEKFAAALKGGKVSKEGEVIESSIFGKVLDFPYTVTDYIKIPDLAKITGTTEAELRDAIAKTDPSISKDVNGVRIHSLLENKGVQELLSNKGFDYIKAKENLSNTESVDNFLKLNDKKQSDLIAESYHQAKADGSNPKLIKSVEDAIGNKPKKQPENKPELSEAQKATDLKEAKEHGFEHPAEALNSIKKRTGFEYKDFQSIPKDVLKEVAQQRKAEKIQEVHDIMKDGIGENPDASTRKKVDDFFNSMKLDTSGKQMYALPIPPQLINGVIEAIHQGVIGGMKLSEAIQHGVEWLRDKGVEGEDLDFAHYRLREDTGMNRAPKEKVQDYLNDGRSDKQITAYLKKQGIPKQVALAIIGDAKDHPIPAKERQMTLDRAEKEHFKLEDDWMGNKEVAKFESQQEARAFQERIQKTAKGQVGADGNKADWKDVDRAIHIHLDLERNPGHAKEFADNLTEKQAKILDMAQHLTPEQKQIAQDISTEYKKVGLMLKDQGIIKDVLEHYVARAWEFGDGKTGTTDMFSKMKTSSRHSLYRSLDTILEGWARGYELKIEGASNNLSALKIEIANVIESKRLIEQGLNLKFDTGQVDMEGKPMMEPLLTTIPGKTDYKPINSRYYKKWDYSGKLLNEYTAEEIQMFDNNTMVTEDGTVMIKKDLFAPEKIAKSLNNILDKSKLTDELKGLTELNRALKTTILSFSGYHYFAFSRAHILVGQIGHLPNVNPITAYKAGLDLMAAHDEHLKELIHHGLTIGRSQDFTEGYTEHLTWLDKQLDKAGWAGDARRKMVGMTDAMHKHLFETYGAGLKSLDAVSLFKAELAKNPNAGPAKRIEIAKGVSKVLNDTYGGENWDRMHGSAMQNPTVRHLLTNTILALDWTTSNLRFSAKALKGGYEGNLYRRLWAKTLIRGMTIGAITNAGLALLNDGDDSKTWPEKLADHYKQAWEQGQASGAHKNVITKTASSLIHLTYSDLTPLYHLLGGDPDKKMYYPIMGAYTDILKAVSDPTKFIDNKLAIVPKMASEAWIGKDWQNKSYTSLPELLGDDDKGQYKRKYKDKKTGDTYMPGDEKGGKLKGQLTKWDYSGGGGGLGWDQMPSFLLAQVRGSMPISAQNIWQGANAERDWIYSAANTAGLGVIAEKDQEKGKK